jgi:hypothetical protein
VDPRAIVRLEGFGQLKNRETSSGFEPACSILPQPTTLPRAPVVVAAAAAAAVVVVVVVVVVAVVVVVKIPSSNNNQIM